MVIAFSSKTGNVRRFVEKCGLPAVQIAEDTVLEEPFVLVTYTTGFGCVPPQVEKFLENNHPNLKAVSSSGNKNWGADMFARSGDLISQKYGVPLLCKFELSGTSSDVENFGRGVANFE